MQRAQSETKQRTSEEHQEHSMVKYNDRAVEQPQTRYEAGSGRIPRTL